jgi:hypothetical protein
VFGAAPQQQTSTTVIDANAQAAQRTSAAAYENAEPGFDQLGQVFGDPDELRSDATPSDEELVKRGWVPAPAPFTTLVAEPLPTSQPPQPKRGT